jgi:hypothetical protein
MSGRLTRAILMLYPRRVREGHGPAIVALMNDLIAHEGRSRTGLLIRLGVDGLIQRITSTATAWTVVALVAGASVGQFVGSDLAAARPFKALPRPACAHNRGDAAHMPDTESSGWRWIAASATRPVRC